VAVAALDGLTAVVPVLLGVAEGVAVSGGDAEGHSGPPQEPPVKDQLMFT
jgi:hypothetical protein